MSGMDLSGQIFGMILCLVVIIALFYFVFVVPRLNRDEEQKNSPDSLKKEEIKMKICPKCKGENPDSITVCEQCGAYLGEAEHSPSENADSKPILACEHKFEDFVIQYLKSISKVQDEQTQYINTIKNCVVFFTILAVIFIVIAIIAYFNISEALDSFSRFSRYF